MKLERNRNIQGIRGIACAMVFVSHTYRMLPCINNYIQSLCMDAGRLGVLIFFLISGVLTGYQDKNYNFSLKEWGNYMVKKINKFYGIYILSVLLMIILTFNSFVRPEWQADHGNLIIRTILHLFLLQSYVPKLGVAYSYNGPAWFLSVCLLLWAVTPLLVRYIKKKCIKSKFYLLCSILLMQCVYLTGIFSMHLSEQRWFMYVCPIFNLMVYSVGLIAGMLTKETWGGRNSVTGVLFAILVVQYLMKNYVPIDFRILYLEPVTVLLICSILKSNSQILKRAVGNKVVAGIGNISTEIFLIHYPVLYLIEALEMNINKELQFLIVLIVTCISSILINKERKIVYEKGLYGRSRSVGKRWHSSRS